MQLQFSLEVKHNWLARRGIKYLFVVAPDKQSVYPEFLSRNYSPLGNHLDQLKEYLKAHSDIQILDLREPLRKAKRNHPVYYKTDTHWNEYGAFIAHCEIMKEIAHVLPGLQPLSPLDFKIIDETAKGMDLAVMLAQGNSIGETVPRLIKLTPPKAVQVEPGYAIPETARVPRSPFATERAGSGLHRAVWFGDSFTFWLVPYLSESFDRIVYVHTLRNDLHKEVVEHERPEIVIDEIVERAISLLLTYPLSQGYMDDFYREKFESSSMILSLSDSRTGYSGINALNEVDVSREPLKKTKVLKLQARGVDPSVLLPLFSFAPGKRLVMKIDILSPADTTLQIFYMTGASREYSESKSIRHSLKKGRNLLYVPLTHPDLYGNIRLDPGDRPGDYFIYSIEVRAIEANPEG